MHLPTNTRTCLCWAPAAELRLPAEGGLCASAGHSGLGAVCPLRPRCVSQNRAPLPASPAGAVAAQFCPRGSPWGRGAWWEGSPCKGQIDVKYILNGETERIFMLFSTHSSVWRCRPYTRLISTSWSGAVCRHVFKGPT